VSVHHRAQTLRTSFVAGDLELFVAERSNSTLTDAARSKNLQHIATVRLHLAHEITDLLVSELLIRQRINRRQNSRSRHNAMIDRVAQRHVFKRSEALNRSEARQQRAPGVALGLKRCSLG